MYPTLLPGRRTHCWGAGPLPLRSRSPAPQQILKQLLTSLAHFYSATLAYFYSGLDTMRGRLKTGHGEWPKTGFVLPCRSGFGKADLISR
jgi:hypothetical protein